MKELPSQQPIGAEVEKGENKKMKDFTESDIDQRNCFEYEKELIDLEAKDNSVKFENNKSLIPPRWIAVMEPVQILQCEVTVMKSSGQILDHSEDFAEIFGYNSTSNTCQCFIGDNIKSFVPGIDFIQDDIKKYSFSNKDNDVKKGKLSIIIYFNFISLILI